MVINNLNKIPKNYSTLEHLSELSTESISILKQMNISEIWYWYVIEDGFGDGCLLMKRGEMYDVHDLSHSDKYSPLYDIKFNGKSLKQVKRLDKHIFFMITKDIFKQTYKKKK